MKICIAWAFSSWKSTLIKALKELNLHIIDESTNKSIKVKCCNEVARTLLNKIWKKSVDLEWEELNNFQYSIFKWQLGLEEKHNNFITDTGIYEDLVYAKQLPCYNQIKEYVYSLKECPYDYIFVCEPLPVEDDWLRFTDKIFQELIYQDLLALYNELGVKYHILKNRWLTKKDNVNGKVKEILNYLKLNYKLDESLLNDDFLKD